MNIENVNKLKESIIESLSNGDQNETYLVYGGKGYNKGELIEELQNETDFGIHLLNNSIMLAIDLYARNKRQLP